MRNYKLQKMEEKSTVFHETYDTTFLPLVTFFSKKKIHFYFLKILDIAKIYV
jgi:hypothetical protein